MKDKNKQKSIDEYRKDIYTLKHRLKDRQQHLQDLRQKYADLDVLRDQSYTYHIKTKILQCSLETLKKQMHKYSKTDAYQCYTLNFSVLALLRSCEVVGIAPQMVYRAVDIDNKKEVSWFDLSSFLKDSLKLDAELSNPLLLALDPDQNGLIPLKRYTFLLQCFMARTQQTGQMNALMECMERVTRLILQKNIDLRTVWTDPQLNIATFSQGLITKLQKLDMLDCIGCYCKCDPLKSGALEKRIAIANFEQKISDLKNFQKGAVRLKKT